MDSRYLSSNFYPQRSTFHDLSSTVLYNRDYQYFLPWSRGIFCIILDKSLYVLYTVLCMQQIVNITQARNNLAKLVEKVKTTKQPIVIVQDSFPSVVLYPYDEAIKNEQRKEELFKKELDELLVEGKKMFKKYLKKRGITKKLTEEEAYEMIKNA